MTRFLFASDSFKGTLSSERIAQILGQEAGKVFADASCSSLPIADGGEGTVDAILAACGGERVHVTVDGPMGEPVDAAYGILPDGRCVIELAAASGITLVDRGALDPLRASTAGFGQLIRHALEHGAHDIFLALGGSATNDGGMGAMRALGVRFLDADGRDLQGRGEDLSDLFTIDVSGLIPEAYMARFTVMCDVTNPLIGRLGATAVFGPQKGGTVETLAQLERGMVGYARIIARQLGVDVASIPGAGAAGGMGAAAAAFLSARLVSGIDCLMDLAHFDELLAECDYLHLGRGTRRRAVTRWQGPLGGRSSLRRRGQAPYHHCGILGRGCRGAPRPRSVQARCLRRSRDPHRGGAGVRGGELPLRRGVRLR